MSEGVLSLLMLVGAIATSAVALGVGTANAVRLRREWVAAAQLAGLFDIEEGGVFFASFKGRFEQLHIRVREERGPLTRFEVEAPGLLPASLELRAEGATSALEKLVDGPDIEVGDEVFDAAVMIKGNPVLVTAALDSPTRRGVLDLVGQKGRVHGGRVSLAVGRRISSKAEMSQTLSALIQLTRNLCSPWRPAARLADNVRNDPVPAVRLRNLELLVARFRGDSETGETMTAALKDPDPAVRLTAACGLGERGREVLADLVNDPGCPEELAARGLRALGPSLGAERALSTLDQALRSRKRPLALAAIEALGRIGGPEAITRLRTVLGAGDEELAIASTRALGATADPAAEPTLLEALHRPGSDMLLAALDALAETGTVNAVPALRNVISSRPLDFGARKAGTAAIAAIQARTTGAAPGQLALTGAEAGELALADDADDEVGGLSLADDGEPPTDLSGT